MTERKIWRWEVVTGICLLNGFRKGAEIGVSHGRFTAFVCGVMQDATLIAIDLWQDYDDGRPDDFKWRKHEKVYENFVAHCDKYLKDRVTICREDSVAAASRVEDGSLDFVFIDGDHTYEGCARDIDAWAPKVRTGGFISGHDYNANWPGVIKAVNERFKEFSVFSDSVWGLLKPE